MALPQPFTRKPHTASGIRPVFPAEPPSRPLDRMLADPAAAIVPQAIARSGSSFASGCNTVWSFRTLAVPDRPSRPVNLSLRPFHAILQSRPLPSAGVTPLPRYYGPIRHPASPACPSRGAGWPVRATDRVSRVATLSIFHACRHQYPGGYRPMPALLASRPVGSLPLNHGGSASALPFSRPARCSLAFRPAWSLSRLKRPFYTKVLQPTSLPP